MPDRSDRGIIFDIERFAITDGPGIRTTVFFKGCPLRCAWCQNPEGMSPRPELLFHEHLCVHCGRCAVACPTGVHEVTSGGHVLYRERCAATGLCARECPAHALELAGHAVTATEVMEVVLRDDAFYRKSGGGITLSGGEPMMQPEFAKALLTSARERRLHTAVDTSGFAPWEAFEEILGLVDLFLYDVKDTDDRRHKEHTGVEFAPILDNLRRLDAAGAKILLRCIIVPGVNDDKRHLDRLAEIRRTIRRVIGIETLQYHSLGLPKWRALGKAALARDFSKRP